MQANIYNTLSIVRGAFFRFEKEIFSNFSLVAARHVPNSTLNAALGNAKENDSVLSYHRELHLDIHDEFNYI